MMNHFIAHSWPFKSQGPEGFVYIIGYKDRDISTFLLVSKFIKHHLYRQSKVLQKNVFYMDFINSPSKLKINVRTLLHSAFPFISPLFLYAKQMAFSHYL